MGLTLKEIKNEYTELLLYKTNFEIIASIPLSFLSSINRSINEIDKLTLNVAKYYTKDNYRYEFYDEFKTERLISLDGEFFVIKECTENEIDNEITIVAYGLEKKLGKINIVVENTGIMLDESFYENDYIIINLGEYLLQETGWSFGHIDDEVLYSNFTNDDSYIKSKNGIELKTSNNDVIEIKRKFNKRMRWLEDIDKDWYTFISEDLAEDFNCVPIFDRVNKKVNLYAIDKFGEDLKISLAKDNYIESLERTYNSSDIITRLTLIGNEDKCIVSDFTDSGRDYIENYSYFIETKEMSTPLINALNTHKDIIKTINPLLKKAREDKVYIQNEIELTKNEWFFYIEYDKKLKEIYDNYISKGNMENAVNIQIELTEGLEKESVLAGKIALLENELEELENQIKQYNIQSNKESCIIEGERLFSDDLLNELKEFTFYDTYSNDSFYDAEELIETGTRELELKCRPTREISLSIESFVDRLIDNRFRQQWSGDLGLGDTISIYSREDDYEELFYLVGYEYNFKDRDLSLTLSNKKTEKNNKKVILNALKNAKTNNKQLQKNKRLFNLLKQNKINIYN